MKINPFSSKSCWRLSRCFGAEQQSQSYSDTFPFPNTVLAPWEQGWDPQLLSRSAAHWCMESFILDAICAPMLWDQGHREGTVCAREKTWYLPSLLQLCWGHFHGTGAAQCPLCQAAMTQVGNKVKSRDQHLGGALDRLFLLGRGQQRMLSPRIPTVWFGSELPLLLPAQLSSVLLESENNTGRKGAPSSHCGSKQQQSCADMEPPARSHCCWELLNRK